MAQLTCKNLTLAEGFPGISAGDRSVRMPEPLRTATIL